MARPIHPGTICADCQFRDIIGLCYKCGHCADYNLCAKCFPYKTHLPNHIFLVLEQPCGERFRPLLTSTPLPFVWTENTANTHEMMMDVQTTSLFPSLSQL